MRFEHACLAFFTTFRCKTDSLTSSSSIHIDWNIHCMNRSKTIIIHFILRGLKITENWDIFSLSLYLSPFGFRLSSIVLQSIFFLYISNIFRILIFVPEIVIMRSRLSNLMYVELCSPVRTSNIPSWHIMIYL